MVINTAFDFDVFWGLRVIIVLCSVTCVAFSTMPFPRQNLRENSDEEEKDDEWLTLPASREDILTVQSQLDQIDKEVQDFCKDRLNFLEKRISGLRMAEASRAATSEYLGPFETQIPLAFEGFIEEKI